MVVPDFVLGDLAPSHFPSGFALDQAAAEFDRFALPRSVRRNGPTPQLVIAPGLVRFQRIDLGKREATRIRAAVRSQAAVDTAAGEPEEGDDVVGDDVPVHLRGSVRVWSRKSRANMVARIASLDLSPLTETSQLQRAMVTLTYPGEGWREVCPDGGAAKRHLKALRRRIEAAFGVVVVALWKFEFQRRGAPHFHLLMLVPTYVAGDLPGSPHIGLPPDSGKPGGAKRSHNERYQGEDRTQTEDARGQSGEGVLDGPGVQERPPGAAPARRGRLGRTPLGHGLHFMQWLSLNWADIVGHPDPVERAKHVAAGTGVDRDEGLRASDPRRVAEYFLKHSAPGQSSKEYQHVVPENWGDPGRFWGYWSLRPDTRTVSLADDDYLFLQRVARRWYRAKGLSRPREVPRGSSAAGTVRSRVVNRRMRRLPNGAGWLAQNDGPAFAMDLGRALLLRPVPSDPRWDPRTPEERRAASQERELARWQAGFDEWKVTHP